MIKSPNPETYFNNRDYGHTFKGFFYGIVVVLLSLASIAWFLHICIHGSHTMDTMDTMDTMEYEYEYGIRSDGLLDDDNDALESLGSHTMDLVNKLPIIEKEWE